MLKLFDPLEAANTRSSSSFAACYSATDLSEFLQIEMEALDLAIQRAVQACKALNLDVESNFQHTFFGSKDGSSAEWELSPLACYLTVINIKPDHPLVANAQLYFARMNHNQEQ